MHDDAHVPVLLEEAVAALAVTAGDAVAAFDKANARQFNIKYIIWKQRIWFPGNGPDQWRWMADRGSITENHYDHVHLSVNP